MSVADRLAPWATIDAALGLATPVRDDAHHAELLAFVDEAFERFGSNEGHPIFGLVWLVADRIREYEELAHPWPETSTPASLVEFLM